MKNNYFDNKKYNLMTQLGLCQLGLMLFILVTQQVDVQAQCANTVPAATLNNANANPYTYTGLTNAMTLTILNETDNVVNVTANSGYRLGGTASANRVYKITFSKPVSCATLYFSEIDNTTAAERLTGFSTNDSLATTAFTNQSTGSSSNLWDATTMTITAGSVSTGATSKSRLQFTADVAFTEIYFLYNRLTPLANPGGVLLTQVDFTESTISPVSLCKCGDTPNCGLNTYTNETLGFAAYDAQTGISSDMRSQHLLHSITGASYEMCVDYTTGPTQTRLAMRHLTAFTSTCTGFSRVYNVKLKSDCNSTNATFIAANLTGGTRNFQYYNVQPNTTYRLCATVALSAACHSRTTGEFLPEYITSSWYTYNATPAAATFAFNCASSVIVGTFSANGLTQTGAITVPITGATAGSVILNVSGTDFSGTLGTVLIAGQTSVSVPITYTGAGSSGTRTLTVTSTQATGTCTKAVTVTPLVGAPGAVSMNLNLWLKANDATATTATWIDQSVNGFTWNATNQPGGSVAVAKPTAAMNFNPAYTFAANSQYFRATGANPASIMANDHTTFIMYATTQVGGDVTYANPMLMSSQSSGFADAQIGIALAGKVGMQVKNVNDLYSGNIVGTSATNDGYPRLFTGSRVRAAAGAAKVSINGLLETSNTNADASVLDIAASANRGMGIGNSGGDYTTAAEQFVGNIAEVISFNRVLTSTEQQKVETYLGIKYGITVAHNYLSAGGNIIFDTTGYSENIAGIGRENIQGLHQRQSQSVNAGKQVLIGHAGALANNNAANANDLTDGQYLIWGDDGGAKFFNTAMAGMAVLNYRFGAIWRVENTGTVGTVRVMWEQGLNNLHLVQSADAVFTSADVFTNMSANTQTINGVTYNYADVTLSDGQFFTFAGYTQFPGCVAANLNLWLQADKGVSTTTDGSTVLSWQNQAINGIDSVWQVTAAARPTYYHTTAANLVNFNPSLSFDGGDELYQANRMFAATSPFTQIAICVDRRTNTAELRAPMGGGYGNGNFIGLDFQTDALSPYGFNPYSGIDAEWVNTAPNYRTYALGLGATNTYGNIAGLTTNNISGGSDNVIAYVNGAKDNTTISANQNALFGSGVYVGSSGDAQWLGLVPEAIIYDRQLTDVEMQRIYSYLAIKYGSTLRQPYLSGAGTVVYDTTGYANNIFGLALDSCQGLAQRQSTSQLSGVQPIFATSGFAATNAANSVNLGADQSFELSGSDAGAATFGTPFVFSNINNRLTRIWKVQETGTVGTIKVGLVKSDLPLRATNITLIRSTNATFDGADERIPMTLETIGGIEYYTASIDFANGNFYTFGAYIIAPGCVAANVNTWFRADDLMGADASAVTSWKDATTGYTIAQPTAGAQPTLYKTNAAHLVNFNPSVSFDGGDELFQANRQFAATSPFTEIAVGVDRRTNPAELRAPMGGGYGNGNFIGLDFQTDGISPQGFNPYSGIDAEWGNTTPNYRLYALGLGVTNTYANMVGLTTNNISGGSDNLIAYVNGAKDNTTISANQNTNFGNGMYLGSSGDAQWLGLVPEAIWYDRQLTDVEMQRIYSYLAIKYGSTLRQPYLSGAGTVVYDTTGYANNIFGLALDSCQGLAQRQSTSQLSGLQPIFATTGFAATNAANTVNLGADQSFELSGSDAGVAFFNTNFAVAPMNNRITRIWKVQESGTVGTIKVALLKSEVQGNVANMHLLRSTNTTFDASDTRIPMVIETIGGIDYYTASIDFNNGDYYTFGAYVLAPGCVAGGLQYWYDAAVTVTGTTDVTAWKDKVNNLSIAKNNAGTIALAAGDAKSNYNPYVLFPANAHLTGVVDPTALGRLHTTFAVAQKDANIDGTYNHPFRFGASAGGGVTHDYAVGTVYNGGVYNAVHHWLSKGSTVNRFNTSQVINFGDVILYGARINGITASSNKDVSVNGNTVTYSDAITGDINANLQIGGSVFGMQGRIPEVAYYNVALSTTEQQRVNTYFGIKYGLTLDHDYLMGDGTKVWDKAAHSAYHNDVFGIALDSCQGLAQKQSRSVMADFQPTISLGALAATNAANTATFAADKSFEMIGSNNLAASYATTYTPSSFTPAAPFYTMSRVWKVQETGTVGTVRITVPTGAERLIVGADAAFTGTNQEIALQSDGNGNVYADVNFTTGQFFTFGKSLTAPGCVIPNLALWVKADASGTGVGANATAWTDFSPNGKAVPAVGTMTVQTPDAVHNYQPYFTGFSTANYFSDPTSALSADATAGGVGTQLTTSLAVFAAVRPNSSTAKGRVTGIDNDPLFAAEPGFSLVGGSPYFYKFSNGTQAFTHTQDVTAGQNAVLSWNFANNTTNGNTVGLKMGLDGLTQSFAGTGSGMVGQKLLIGNAQGWDQPYPFEGDIQEVIWYKSDVSPAQAQRIQSYLGLKYGTTLKHNYLSGAGVTIYDTTGYGKNIFGIGRDDCQTLLTKQSRSANATGKMTVGLGDTIATTNAANPSVFAKDKAFLVMGDNGATGVSSFPTTAGACPPPASSDKFTNLNYKVTETDSVASVKLRFDATGQGFNSLYPIYMQVASDAAFTNMIVSVPMLMSGTIGTTNYDFPANSTVYLRFSGNTVSPANVCAATKVQTFNFNGWYYGTKTKDIAANYATTANAGDMVMKATVSDGSPNVLLYRPTVDWWPVFDGLGLFIPRYGNASNQSSTITTKLQFLTQTANGAPSASATKVAAQTVDFVIRDLDGYIGSRDVVKVYGKLGTATVTPKMTRNKYYSDVTLNYTGDPTQAIGSVLPWDLTILADLYVNFDSPVEEIYVEYTQKATYSFKTYQDLRIGKINATCKIPTPKVVTPDNVYLYKQAIATTEKVGEKVTYKFTLQNTNCADKTLNFNDVLPATMTWVDSSLTTSLTLGSVNNYGTTNTLTIGSITVPPGVSYLYVDAVGTAAGTYNNQATFTVNGNSYLSDDPSVTGANSPTPVTLIANDPDANITVTKAVDKPTAARDSILTYTFTINNPNASAMNVTFQDHLPGSPDDSPTFVAASLTGAGAAMVSSYGGTNSITIRNLSAAPGNTVMTIKVNVGQFTIGDTIKNIASVIPDVASGFRLATKMSGVATTKVIASCLAGNSQPALSVTNKANACPATTVHLGTITASNQPVGAILTWHTATPATTANKVPDSSAVAAGTYYAAFYDQALGCFSGNGDSTRAVTATVTTCCATVAITPALSATTGTNTCPTITADLTTITASNTPGGTVLTFHTNAIATTANKVTTPTAVGAGTYYAAFYNAASDCYSSTPTTITVTTSICTTPPPVQTPTGGSTRTGDARTELNPTGGTPGYTYSNGSSDAACTAPVVGAQPLPMSSNLIVGSNGAYSYTAPTTLGTYYFCIKVCDNGTPQVCKIATYTVTVGCATGNAIPTLSASTASNTCPTSTVNLGNITASNRPAGTVLTWHNATPVSLANKVADSSAVGAGTYYAAFYDAVANCFANGGNNTATVTVTTTNCNAGGTIDCSKTEIYPAPKAGVVSSHSLIVTVNATQTGAFSPITITGNGFSLATPGYTIAVTTLGVQRFHIPINYDGSALGTLQFVIGAAGTCSADMTVAPRPVTRNVYQLDNCSAVTPGTIVK